MEKYTNNYRLIFMCNNIRQNPRPIMDIQDNAILVLNQLKKSFVWTNWKKNAYKKKYNINQCYLETVIDSEDKDMRKK